MDTNEREENVQVHIYYRDNEVIKCEKLICREGDPSIDFTIELTPEFPTVIATQETRTYTFYSVVRVEFYGEGILRETRNYFPAKQSDFLSATL